MRYSISDDGDDVEIRVQETGEHTPQLLASLRQCQDGNCGCPTDQYDRLADMSVDVAGDEVAIRLRPRSGERLDVGQLQDCLDYTLAQSQNSNR